MAFKFYSKQYSRTNHYTIINSIQIHLYYFLSCFRAMAVELRMWPFNLLIDITNLNFSSHILQRKNVKE